MSPGAFVVSDAGRPAFYALRPGGWRDLITLLHPPYTAWHLSYVALGAAAAPTIHADRLLAALGAFFLAVGVSAHALDELNGRPLRTRIPQRALRAIAYVGLVGAVAVGLVGVVKVSWWLLAFVGFGAFIVIAYNLELFGGRFHSDAWFALAWGAFPALTAYYAQAETVRLAGVLVAAACMLLSAAQRTLSTPVRRLRRAAVSVSGEIRYADGSAPEIRESDLRHAPELALRTLSVALPLLALALVLFRLDWLGRDRDHAARRSSVSASASSSSRRMPDTVTPAISPMAMAASPYHRPSMDHPIMRSTENEPGPTNARVATATEYTSGSSIPPSLFHTPFSACTAMIALTITPMIIAAASGVISPRTSNDPPTVSVSPASPAMRLPGL